MARKIINIFDFETTGLDFTIHKVIEWGVKTRDVNGNWNASREYIIPEPGAFFTEVAGYKTGLTLELLHEKGRPRLNSYKLLLEKLNVHKNADFSKIVFVGHNILNFDLPHLELICLEMGFELPMEQLGIWDTAAIYKATKLGYVQKDDETFMQFQIRALSKIQKGLKFNQVLVCEEMGIKMDNAHQALADVEGVYEILKRQVRQFPTEAEKLFTY